MYFALVYYPKIEDEAFHSFRDIYEPYSFLMREHIPFIFPVPESIGLFELEVYIQETLVNWKPFEIHICGYQKTWDHWLMLVLQEGNEVVISIHDELYTGMLTPYLRHDLPFIPHVGLGHFGKEAYDFHNPLAELTLDMTKYQKAKPELEKLKLDYWRTIDHLTLVKVNSDFTKCWNIKDFNLIKS